MTLRLDDSRPRRAVITYGTFDRFDLAQARQLEHICEMGTTIIVGVSTDELAARKGERPIARYAERAAMVRHFPGVDTVIPETGWEQRVMDLLAYDIDLLVVGFGCRSRCDHLADLCEVRYLDGNARAVGNRAGVPSCREEAVSMALPVPMMLTTWEPSDALLAQSTSKAAANQPRLVTRERLAAAYAV
ncbi:MULTISPECIES: hypothetical protein [unclassified Cupriavidus]|uniref:hypothetical protein n=1 Tax=unclassified Cupriavidus TaxID=2640874 RepID=UPI00313C7D6A